MSASRPFAIGFLAALCVSASHARYIPIVEMEQTADMVAFGTVDRVLSADQFQLRISQAIKGQPSSPVVAVATGSKCPTGGFGGPGRLCARLKPDDVGVPGLWFLKSVDSGYQVIPRNSMAHTFDELFVPLRVESRKVPAPEALDDALLAWLVEWFQAQPASAANAGAALSGGLGHVAAARPTSQQIFAALAPLIQSPYPTQHVIGLSLALREDSVEAMKQVVHEFPSLRWNPRIREIVSSIGDYPAAGGPKDPRWVAPLRQLLNFHADIPGLDAAVAGALYRIGTPETFPMIVELLDSKDPGAQMIAVRTLAIRLATDDVTRSHSPGWLGSTLTTPEFVAFWKSWWNENHARLGQPLVDPNATREATAVGSKPLPAPFINPAGIVRGDTSRVGVLSPGLVVSIYGRDFGPHAGCTGTAKEVCGVKVLLDGQPIDIEYVNDLLINVRIPNVRPVQADGRIAVVSGGRYSDPAEIRRLP